MGSLPPVKRYTPDEYYRLEREAVEKSEYYKGEIFAMSGNTTRHSLIVMNIGGVLWQRLKGNPCAPCDSNQRLKVKANGLRAYPDVSVYCGSIEYDEQDSQAETATNPTILFEVLSPSTERYDRGFKSASYRLIPSLRAYVLVSQNEPRIEVFERQPEAGARGDGSHFVGSASADAIARIPGRFRYRIVPSAKADPTKIRRDRATLFRFAPRRPAFSAHPTTACSPAYLPA